MSNIDKLKSAAAKAVDNFDPNMFVETRDVLALLNELEAAGNRIAELEALEVTLPQRLQPGADGYDDWYVHSADDGEYLKADDVIAALRAAGIGVKG
ncbi:hypothetical protein NLN86_25775, partial [Citrobacter portucalensis]|nr:hypothetical protein [Citrobacter portucalensis]